MKTTRRLNHFYRRQVSSLARFFRIKKELNYFIATALASLLFALILNARYQAERYAASLADKAEFAVFLSKEAVPETVARQLVALPGVARIRFVNREQALDTALQGAPELKDLIISGDNPFSPFFLLYPAVIKADFVQQAEGSVSAIKGVDGTAFDPGVFALYETLHNASKFTRIISLSVLAGFMIIAGFAFIRKWFFRKIDYRRYIYLAGWGVVSGGCGMGMYYAASRYALPYAAAQMPLEQMALLIPVAMIMNFAWEK